MEKKYKNKQTKTSYLQLPAVTRSTSASAVVGPNVTAGTFAFTFVLMLALPPPGLGGACYSTSPHVNFLPKEAVMIGPAL